MIDVNHNMATKGLDLITFTLGEDCELLTKNINHFIAGGKLHDVYTGEILELNNINERFYISCYINEIIRMGTILDELRHKLGMIEVKGRSFL